MRALEGRWLLTFIGALLPAMRGGGRLSPVEALGGFEQGRG